MFRQCFTLIISVQCYNISYVLAMLFPFSCVPAVLLLHELCNSGSVRTSTVLYGAVFISPSVVFQQCHYLNHFCSGSVLPPPVLFRQMLYLHQLCSGSVLPPSICVPAVLYLHQLCSGSVFPPSVVFRQCYTAISCVPAVLYLNQFCSGSSQASISSVMVVLFLHQLCSGSVIPPSVLTT